MGNFPPLTTPLVLRTLRKAVWEKIRLDPTASMLDVDELISFGCKIDRRYMLSQPTLAIPPREWARTIALAEQRITGTPVQLLTGKTQFYGLSLAVRRGVLLPRPETEQLVETVLDWTHERVGTRPMTILELGIGSGAIGLSLAHHRPTATIIGWDISRRAVTLAQRNQSQLGITNCQFLEGDFFKEKVRWESLAKEKKQVILVSNPPYIPTSVLPTLDLSVQQNDPKRALDGGATGLRFHRKLIHLAAQYRWPLFLEIGYDQTMSIQRIGKQLNMEPTIIYDYSNNPRIAIITTTNTPRFGEFPSGPAK